MDVTWACGLVYHNNTDNNHHHNNNIMYEQCAYVRFPAFYSHASDATNLICLNLSPSEGLEAFSAVTIGYFYFDS